MKNGRHVCEQAGRGESRSVHHLSRLLETSSYDTAEHVDTDTLALDLAAGLVLLVLGHSHDGSGLVDLPSADIDDELLEGLTASQVQPLSEHVGADLTECLANFDGNADTHQLLEPGDVGDQIGIQVVRVERRPEQGVLGRLEQSVQASKLLDRLDEVRGLRLGLSLAVGRREGLCVRREQRKGERKGRRGEDSEGLGEDVRRRLRLEEVGVELVAVSNENCIVVSKSLSKIIMECSV